MSFAKAQRQWEQSWIDGPPDDPNEDYIEQLREMDGEQLRLELARARDSLRDTEGCRSLQHVLDAVHMVETEIHERCEQSA